MTDFVMIGNVAHTLFMLDCPPSQSAATNAVSLWETASTDARRFYFERASAVVAALDLPSIRARVEARVRAELAEQLSAQANELRAAYRRGPYKHSIDYIEGWEDAGNWLESIAAGSSQDTALEAEDYPGQRSKPDACPVCGGPIECEQLETGVAPYWSTIVPGRWTCPKGCDPRTAAKAKPTREEIIEAARRIHDREGCGCDRKYLMSCARMAAAILRARQSTTTEAGNG